MNIFLIVIQKQHVIFLKKNPGKWNNGLKFQGNRTTPSYVAFTDTERLIGDAAKNQVAMNPHNTVFDAKRLIGRKFDDAAVQSDMKHWPFKVGSKKWKILKIWPENDAFL